SGAFDAGVIGDPVLERGLSIVPGSTSDPLPGSSSGAGGSNSISAAGGGRPTTTTSVGVSRPPHQPQPLGPLGGRDAILASRQPPVRPVGAGAGRAPLGGPIDDLFAGR